MNTPVNFELAKLLKEKGFDEYTKIWHQRGDGVVGCVEGKRDFYNRKGDVYTSALTIAEVVMWLYEKHGIWISVIDVSPSHILWEYQISRKEIGLTYSSGQYPVKHNYSPTEAYEAAINYTLNNII